MPQLSESQLLQPGQIFENKFRILSTIGAGGVGVIYKAQHVHTKRMLAIKMLHSTELDRENEFLRFEQEAEAASHFNHKNIVTIHDFGVTADGVAFLVMEYLDGPTLDHILKTDGRVTMEQFMHIFPQVCAGLQHAHKKGIVHRDIKPSNLMIVDTEDEKGVLKIVDFGLAKPSGQDVEKHLTQTGIVLGTPLFMSPEQCRGREVDFHTDIYSLGCVMYAAITGIYPFEGESTMDTLYLHIAEPPKPFSQVVPELNLPTSLETVIFKALSKEPTQRQSSMQELGYELIASTKADELPLKEEKTLAKTIPTRSVSEIVKGPKPEDQRLQPAMPAKPLAQSMRYAQIDKSSNSTKKMVTLLVAAATIVAVGTVTIMHRAKHEAAKKGAAETTTPENAPPQTVNKSGKNDAANSATASAATQHEPNKQKESNKQNESRPSSAPESHKLAALPPRAEQPVLTVPKPLSVEQEAMMHKQRGEKSMLEKNYGDALPEFEAWLNIERRVHGDFAPQLITPLSRVIAALHAEHNEDSVRGYLSEAETIIQRNGVANSATTVSSKIKHPDSVWRALAQASFYLAGLYGRENSDLSIQQYKWSIDFFELAFKTWNEPNNPNYATAQQDVARAKQIVSAAEQPQVPTMRQQGQWAKMWQRRRMENLEGAKRYFR